MRICEHCGEQVKTWGLYTLLYRSQTSLGINARIRSNRANPIQVVYTVFACCHSDQRGYSA